MAATRLPVGAPVPAPAPPSPAHGAPVVLLGWVTARLVVAVVYAATDFAGRSLAWGDLALYEFWARQIAATGAMPDGVTWMYPPLAAAVLLLADVLPGPFGPGFVALVLLADLAVLLLLLQAHRRGSAHPAGMWAWVVLVPLLGLISWARLDLVPVVFAAAALLLAARRPALAGVMAALGTSAKGWPVVLGLLFLRERRWLAGALVAGTAVAVASTLLLDGTWTFLRNLSGRGIQVESPMALPWTLQQALGTPVDGDFVNGTYEVLEPGAAVLARVATLLMLVVVGLGLWLSRRRTPALRWYVAVVALLATSPLLSTQFVLWLVGGAAVAAAVPGPDGRLARRTLPLVAALVLLTHLTFPLQWGGLVGDGQLAAASLLVRNLLLLGLAVWLLVAARGGGDGATVDVPAREAPVGG
ncbi:glycosyltransferase 87 family protein [Aquipuribacter hungaricus]|uniref:Glycosyltransferase 87 family protein n=1 Tax=Aquipuribacter hungaricus TaxID=545624 RepID=A0ABV7WGM9_9MICO